MGAGFNTGPAHLSIGARIRTREGNGQGVPRAGPEDIKVIQAGTGDPWGDLALGSCVDGDTRA